MNFLPQQIQAFSNDPDTLKVLRRQQMAEALLQDSMAPINPNRQAGRFVAAISPFEGLAKMLQAGLGAYQFKRSEEDLANLSKSKRDALVKSLRGEQMDAQRPPEEFSMDLEDAPYQSKYAQAFGRGSANRINLTPENVEAPKVRVQGDWRQEAQGEPDFWQLQKNRIADMLETNAITPQEGRAKLEAVENLRMQIEAEKIKPRTIGVGEEFGVPGQAPLMKGREPYRAPQIIKSGAGNDPQGRPLEVDKLLFPGSQTAVDIQGISPVTKGPLASATANVGMALEKEEQKEKGKANVKLYEGVRDTGSAARKANAALDVMDRALSRGNFETGFMGDTRKAAADALTFLGSKNAEAASVDANSFKAAAMDLVLQKQLAQKGPQTESDAKRMESTVASIKTPVEANKFLISYARALNNRDIAQQEFFDRYWQQKGTYEGAEAAWFGYGDKSIPGSGGGSKSIFEEPSLSRFNAPAPSSGALSPQEKKELEELRRRFKK